MTDAKIAPLNSRCVISIAGPEAVSFLQGIVSQNIEEMKVGEARFSALLTPQGKILFDFFVVAAGDGFLLDCFAPEAEALLKRLKLYKLRARVDLAIDDNVKVYAYWNKEPKRSTSDKMFEDPRNATLGWRCFEAPDAITSIEEDYHHHRISLGVPQFGDDFSSEEVFLLDVNYDMLNGVDYKKGCFVGQEVTSRMKRKGEIRKRTACVTLPQSTATKGSIAKGADIVAGDTTLGTVLATSVEHHAIGMIRIDRFKKTSDREIRPTINENDVEILIPVYLKGA